MLAWVIIKKKKTPIKFSLPQKSHRSKAILASH